MLPLYAQALFMRIMQVDIRSHKLCGNYFSYIYNKR